MDRIIYYILTAVAVLITLSIHEYCHGYAAYKLGDPTARNLGRLTLNPIKHLDPIGALCMVLFHFGWAKPVPINPRYFKKPKRDFAITALAGPLSNLVIAFAAAFLYAVAYKLLSSISYANEFVLSLAQNTLNFIFIFHAVNIGLALFNLIPVPPLDGSRLLNALLPAKAYFAIMKHERKIYYFMIGWLLLGGYISSFLLSIPLVSNTPVLSAIAQLFSLSDLLAKAIDGLSDLMIKLFQSIPFLRT